MSPQARGNRGASQLEEGGIQLNVHHRSVDAPSGRNPRAGDDQADAVIEGRDVAIVGGSGPAEARFQNRSGDPVVGAGGLPGLGQAFRAVAGTAR